MAKCVLAFLLVLIILITHLFSLTAAYCVNVAISILYYPPPCAKKWGSEETLLQRPPAQEKPNPTYCNHTTMPTCSTVHTSKYRTLFHLLSWTIPNSEHATLFLLLCFLFAWCVPSFQSQPSLRGIECRPLHLLLLLRRRFLLPPGDWLTYAPPSLPPASFSFSLPPSCPTSL